MTKVIPWCAISAICLLGGCSSGYNPVVGKVTYSNGDAVTAGMVVAEKSVSESEKRYSANGNIQPDGTFELTTLKPGDGVPEGRYRVAVVSPPLSDDQVGRGEKPLVDAKYAQHDTSGLEIDVKPGRNEVSLTVSKPGASKQ